MCSVPLLIGLLCALVLSKTDEIWEQDMSSDMKIGLSTTGYRKVDLRCGADAFLINVTLDNDFEGVIYTRGSFNQKNLPCFKSHNQHKTLQDGQILINFRVPFDKCQTVMDVAESRYTNTLILQHDQDLIMPGDAAFSLDCAFIPEFKMSADLSTDPLPFKSKITLVDADPSATREKSDEKTLTAHSETESVSFQPPRDEL